MRDKIEQVETMSTVHRNTFAKLLFNLLKGGAIAITCLKVRVMMMVAIGF